MDIERIILASELATYAIVQPSLTLAQINSRDEQPIISVSSSCYTFTVDQEMHENILMFVRVEFPPRMPVAETDIFWLDIEYLDSGRVIPIGQINNRLLERSFDGYIKNPQNALRPNTALSINVLHQGRDADNIIAAFPYITAPSCLETDSDSWISSLQDDLLKLGLVLDNPATIPLHQYIDRYGAVL